jgi:putative DNA primase/helicase
MKTTNDHHQRVMFVADPPKPSQASSQVVGAALSYAQTGMAVFPVRADKTPLTPHGLKDATIDPPSIAAWWRIYPFADIGCALPPSIVVIDIDRKPGRDGYRDFQLLAGVSVDAFESPQAATPSGGRHLFCTTNSSRYRNGVRIAGTGIDLRAYGGYVVLPSPGNGRAWLKTLSIPLAAVPAWIPAASEGSLQPRTSSCSPAPPETLVYRGDTPYALATLKRVCLNIRNAPDGLQETTLNGACFKIGTLIGAGQLSAASVQQLLDAALAMPSHRYPPWDPTKLQTKVIGAVEQGMQRPFFPSSGSR